MSVSTKLKDIQPGRVLQIAAANGRRASSMLIDDVRKFQNAAQVKGVKLGRNGQPHASGKVHSVLVENGDFLVTWTPNKAVDGDNAEAPADAESAAAV